MARSSVTATAKPIFTNGGISGACGLSTDCVTGAQCARQSTGWSSCIPSQSIIALVSSVVVATVPTLPERAVGEHSYQASATWANSKLAIVTSAIRERHLRKRFITV